MSEQRVVEIMEEVGGLLTGHFVYTPKDGEWYHGKEYVNKDRLYTKPMLVAEVCEMFVEPLSDVDIEVAVSPAVGGVALCQHIPLCFFMHTGEKIDAAYTEKSEGSMVFNRGYGETVEGRKVGVFEDIVNSGGSQEKTIRAVQDAGGEVVALGAIWNRGGEKARERLLDAVDADIPLVFLVDRPMVKYHEDDCPLCMDDIGSVTLKPGHGEEWLKEKNLFEEWRKSNAPQK